MTLLSFSFLSALSGSLIFFSWRRLKTLLHLFQQHEYDSKRFLIWCLQSRTFDKRLSAVLILVLVILSLTPLTSPYFTPLIVAGLFLAFGALEANPAKRAKKPLVMTLRARRIFILSLSLSICLAVGVFLTPAAFFWQALWYLAFIHLQPLILVIADRLLSPYEARVQKKLWHEAHDKLLSLAPIVIGITGSFGKTSAKHILGHILSLHAPTLMTPGSVNTPMGITRIIREKLTADHRYFIVEMGAYGPGSIERLCRLAPPDSALITAIGLAHYERFQSLDRVVRTKFELAEATASKKGQVYFPFHLLSFDEIKAFVNAHPSSTKLIEVDADSEQMNRTTAPDQPPVSLKLKEVEQTAQGLNISLNDQGETISLSCPLFGRHQAANIALAYALARDLGVSQETLATALKTMPQISHRLEVKRQQGWTLIDDAFNANPEGIREGMMLLSTLVAPGGRRIIITPGCVELGKRHDQEHERLGRLAADYVDLLILIKPERLETMVSGFRERVAYNKRQEPDKPSPDLMTFARYSEAQSWLFSKVGAGDAVLLANDLPDIYETRIPM